MGERIVHLGSIYMTDIVKLLDTVALTEDMPTHGLVRGQVGTVVETIAPGVYEIEFSDNEGRTYTSVSAREGQLMVLHDRPSQGGLNICFDLTK